MSIYVLDDDGTIEEVVKKAFPGKIVVRYAESVPFINTLVESRNVELVVIDLVIQRDQSRAEMFISRNPNVEGFFVLQRVRKFLHKIPVILATKFARDDIFIKALNLGGIPLEITSIEDAVTKLRQLVPDVSGEIEELKRIAGKYREAGFVAVSTQTLKVIDLAEKFVKSSNPILITGEVGTGKDALAKAMATVHDFPKFVSFDIGNYSDDPAHIHTQLFGVGKNVFTGVSEYPGLFEIVGNGLLFLNEIGDLPLKLQGKLLEVIETRTFYRMGTSKPLRFKGKLVLATNKNLKDMVQKGKFREDLFTRIFSHHIHIPPLRERRDDIPELIKFKAPYLKFTDKAIDFLVNKYDFPGNVRTLFKILDRFEDFDLNTVQLDDVIIATRLIGEIRNDPELQVVSPESILEYLIDNNITIKELEEKIWEAAVRKFGLRWSDATWKKLGISRARFFRWKKERFRGSFRKGT